MALRIEPLTPVFGATVSGLDTSQPLSPEVQAEISAAFEEYSVLVLHD